MESIILDPLEYRIDRPSLLAELRLKEGSGHAKMVEGLIREAEAIAHPRAICRMAFIESRGDRHVVAEGLRFESRILKVNLENLHRFFAFAVTSGRELEAWANARTDLLERFWTDAINQAVLTSACLFLNRHLQERYGLEKTAHMSPGSLPDWPLEEQRALFDLLGDNRKIIGIELTESLLMVPVKSLSGIIFTNEDGFASCRLCPRKGCPGRRAPFDPGLYERKYRDPLQASHLGHPVKTH
jgi:hypothetical protein